MGDGDLTRHLLGHGARARLKVRGEAEAAWVLGSYHPSQQNTHTGRLTRPMFDRVLREAIGLARSTS